MITAGVSTGCGEPGRDHARLGRRALRGVASLLPLLLSLFVLGTVAVAPLLRGPAPAPGTATSSPRSTSVVPTRHRGDERDGRALHSARGALAPAAAHPSAGDSPADVPPGTVVLRRPVTGDAAAAVVTTRAGTLVAGLPDRRGPPAQVPAPAPLPESLVHVHPRPA